MVDQVSVMSTSSTVNLMGILDLLVCVITELMEQTLPKCTAINLIHLLTLKTCSILYGVVFTNFLALLELS